MGSAALALLPLLLAFTDAAHGPGIIAMVLLAWPLVTALSALRAGKSDRAYRIGVVLQSGILAGFASLTGGLLSPAMPALAIVLGIAFALGGPRSRSAATALTIASILALSLSQWAGLIMPAELAAIVPMPTWAYAMLMAAPSVLHAVLWMLDARRALEQQTNALNDGAERYQRMINNSPDLITVHNRAGNLVFASHAATRLLGAQPCQIRDAGLFNRVHVADRPTYLRLIDAALTGQEPESADLRLRIGDLDGDTAPAYGWFELRCRAIPGSQDIAAVFRETGSRKAHEEERDAAIVECERANAMKTRFLASVSHELRTPLNAIIGFSEVLNQEVVGDLDEAKQKEYAGHILESGHHLLGVVNHILDMSKIEAGRFDVFPEPFALEEALQTTVAMVAGKAEENRVKIELAIEPHLPDLNADRQAVTQICLNLLSNAVKFTREELGEDARRVWLSAVRRGKNIRLSVRDNGIGIAPEDVTHVGEPFFQAHANYNRQFEGTGLGLSVVNGLAELHGGCIEVDSTLGQGTTVTVVLPIAGPQEVGETDDENLVTVLDTNRRPPASNTHNAVRADLEAVDELIRHTG